MALKFFHLPQARKFKYNPLFYDPELEERKERESRIKAELGIIDESIEGGIGDYRARIKGQFRKAMRRESKTSLAMRQKSNRRLLIILAILIMLFYLLFYR